jgi:hypothetical protein
MYYLGTTDWLREKRGYVLKNFAAALVLGCALVATAAAGATTGHAGSGAAAAPPIVWGAADDTSKFAEDGGTWFFGQLKGAGLTSNRWTLAWDASQPTVIKEQAFLERAAPQAQAAGVRVLLALYAGTPAPTASQHDVEGFCTWAGQVASLAKSWGIHDFIVWNEPNTRLYWMPQKDASGNDVAAPAYEALLARCYDTIHANDENANVIGMGLSPRASTKESNEPLSFLRNVGKAYRASGRTKPIMDQLSVHPYPNPNSPTDSPDVGYEVADRFGISNMDRVKQAVYDAFNGTAQPTTLNGLTLVIDEVGWQTDTTGLTGYVNDENVKTISETTQTAYLKTMARKYFACDPAIVSVQLFLLMDEPYRNGKNEVGQTVGGGWQSGLITAGGPTLSRPKDAYTSVAADFSAGRAACQGAMINWRPIGGTGGNGGSGDTGVPGAKPAKGTATAGSLDWAGGDLATVLGNLTNTMAALQASLRPASGQTIAQLGPSVRPLLNQILAAFRTSETDLTGSVSVLTCGTTANCTVAGALKQLFRGGGVRSLSVSAAAYKSIATAKLSATAGSKAKAALKFGLAPGAKAPAGKYFLVTVVQNADDSTQRYGFAVQLRSVTAAKAKPAAKKSKKK